MYKIEAIIRDCKRRPNIKAVLVCPNLHRANYHFEEAREIIGKEPKYRISQRKIIFPNKTVLKFIADPQRETIRGIKAQIYYDSISEWASV